MVYVCLCAVQYNTGDVSDVPGVTLQYFGVSRRDARNSLLTMSRSQTTNSYLLTVSAGLVLVVVVVFVVVVVVVAMLVVAR